MDSWHATFLGLRHLPREVTAFEIEAFYQFSAEECRVIEERRRPELKLALALQIGFLRMSGRLLEAVRIVPPLLWKHLGARFNVAAPDLASLRAMYRRAPTLIEHQQLACETLGFRWLSEHHRRGLVRVMREELTRTDDPQRLLGFVRRWLYDHRSSWVALCQVAGRPTTSDGPFKNYGSDAISAGTLRSSVHAPRTTDPRASSSTIATFIEFGAHATSTRDSPEASLSRTSRVLPLSRSTKDMLCSARIAYLPSRDLTSLAWHKAPIKRAATTVRFLFMKS